MTLGGSYFKVEIHRCRRQNVMAAHSTMLEPRKQSSIQYDEANINEWNANRFVVSEAGTTKETKIDMQLRKVTKKLSFNFIFRRNFICFGCTHGNTRSAAMQGNNHCVPWFSAPRILVQTSPGSIVAAACVVDERKSW